MVIIKLSSLNLSSQLNNSNKVLQDLNEGGNMIKRIVILCISISVLGILHAQYNPDNHVVTISKYYLKALSDVEDGSAEERKEVFEENAKKMNPLQERLISTMVLGHFWTGTSNEVLEINEWASMTDADASVRTTADTRKKAWRKDEDRVEFMSKFNKYWVGKHTDVSVLELNMDVLKRPTRKYKENTIVTMVQYNLAPLSKVEDGSAEDRKEVLQNFFDNVVKKDDKVLSHMELTHYWSGSAGGPEGWPVIVVNEYATIEDAMDQDNSALVEKAWPDEEERKAFFKKFNAYWSNGYHKDLEIRNHWVSLRK